MLARASLRSPETQRVLIHRLLAERDRLEQSDRSFAGCLHAAAVLAKVAPGLEDAALTDLQRILRDLVRFVDAVAPRADDPSEIKSLNDAHLGEVLVELGFVEESDVREALSRAGGRRLGDVLVESGKVTRRDVEAAENLHRTMSGKRDENGDPKRRTP